jgi:hypothetical protein
MVSEAESLRQIEERQNLERRFLDLNDRYEAARQFFEALFPEEDWSPMASQVYKKARSVNCEHGDCEKKHEEHGDILAKARDAMKNYKNGDELPDLTQANETFRNLVERHEDFIVVMENFMTLFEDRD